MLVFYVGGSEVWQIMTLIDPPQVAVMDAAYWPWNATPWHGEALPWPYTISKLINTWI